MTIKENIMLYIQQYPGVTDSEIAKHLKKKHQSINQACRDLEMDGYLVRKNNLEKGNHIGNYPLDKIYKINHISLHKQRVNSKDIEYLQEEDVKRIINDYLIRDEWNTKVAWGHQHGTDIEAVKNNKRWIIEVKGSGSRQPMRVNYFLSILGEILQRMDDSNARYSIALPDIEQYRRLWDRLPKLAKERTRIDLILVDAKENIYFLN